MKKVYSFMLALFATLCVGTAYAEDPEEEALEPITITLNLDDPDAVNVYANGAWSPMTTMTAGDNLITITPQEDWMGWYYPEVTIEVNEGYGIQEITASVEEVPTFYLQYAGVYMMSPSELCNDVTYTVSTYAYADMRTDSVIVLIDDETKATMQYGNGQGILLDSTVNVVYFSTDEDVADLPLIVRSASYGSYLYEVTLNDSVIADYGSGYQMYEVESGDTIRISANAPDDLTFPVIFAWADDADKGALDSLQVDGVTVEYKDTIEVAWGKEVKMWFNVTEYLIKVDNSTVSSTYSPYYSETILDTTVWEITSAKYEDFDVTIIAHNPGCFQVQKSSDYSYATLVEGTNTISLNTKNTYIYIRTNTDCVIDSVKVNGELKESYSSVQCEKNMTIEIWGDSIRRDQTFMLYVDTVANYNYNVRTATYKYLAYYWSGPFLTDGYSTFAFADADNPIGVSVGYGKNAVCYLNDSIVTLNWGSCSLRLADGDVVKVFADTAEVYTVGIYAAGDAVVENATKDRIVAITELNTDFTVLQGTEVSFETETTVLVNGVAVEGVDGVYTLVINENTTIVVGELTSCAEANVAEANTILVMDEFVVAYVNGSYTYIQDATGSTLIYKFDYGLNAGDTVTGLVGKISVYNNLVEIVPSVTVDKLNVKAGVAPEPALQEEIITLADVNKYIRLEAVTVNEADTFTTAGKETINAVWNDTPLVIYNQFKVAQTFSADSIYDIVCAISVFKEQLQVYLISAEAVASKLQPGTTLPLYDFESETTNDDWVLINGTAANQWVIGNATAYNSNQSLYISNNGTDYGYNSSEYSVVWAYINTPITGDVNISFEWKGYGESGYDYMRACLVPTGDIDYVETGSDYIPDGAIILGGIFSGSDDWQSYISGCVQLQGDYYLAFMWRNDGSLGDSPIAIDNVQVQGISYESYQVSITAGDNGFLSTGDWEGAFTDRCDSQPIEVCAIPDDHYKFVGWSDGVSDECRSIYPVQDTTIVALFEAKIQCTLVVGVDNSSKDMGTVSGSGIFEEGDLATIIATPKEGYHFVEWSDGNGYAMRNIILTSDTILFATFAAGEYGGKCGDNLYWAWEDGALSITGTGDMDLFTYPAWWQHFIDIESVTFPETMTSISSFAFYGYYNLGVYQAPYSLKEVIVPSSVNYIGYGAFAFCPQLTKWQYNGADLEVQYMEGYGHDIFYGDDAITFLQAPSELIEYSNNSWSNLDTLIVVSGGIETIPANVSYLDLRNAINLPVSLAGRENLKTLYLPNDLTEISDKALLDCKHLGGIIIPANVSRIGESAFEDCRSMETVVFAGNNVTTIGDWAFYNCHSLGQINIPEGVEEIGNAAFYGCTFLRELTIPSTTKKIAQNGFALCSKMQTMYVNALVPPTIEAKTFEDVDRATPVFVPRGTMELYQADQYWREFFNMAEYEAPTGNLNTSADEANGLRKVVRDGQVLIIRGDMVYTVLGEQMK